MVAPVLYENVTSVLNTISHKIFIKNDHGCKMNLRIIYEILDVTKMGVK